MKGCVSDAYVAFIVQKFVTIVHDPIEACKAKEAVIIATEWKEFLDLDWQTVYDNMSKPAFVFDGRLLVDADKLRKIGFKVCASMFITTELANERVIYRFRSLAAANAFKPTPAFVL